MEQKKYFYGNEISDYGVQHNRVDYRTLAKCFDGVLCNDITKLFYSDINGEFNEPEQINGYIDNSDVINELNEQIDELTAQLDDGDGDALQEQIDALQEQIDELQREQDEQPEIFQYYIISWQGAQLLQDLTDEIIYYLPAIDVYIWGVTHYGTSWDYVLTDIKIDKNGD